MVSGPRSHGRRAVDGDGALDSIRRVRKIARVADHRGQVSADQVGQRMDFFLQPFRISEQRHGYFIHCFKECEAGIKRRIQGLLQETDQPLQSGGEHCHFMQQKATNNSRLALSQIYRRLMLTGGNFRCLFRGLPGKYSNSNGDYPNGASGDDSPCVPVDSTRLAQRPALQEDLPQELFHPYPLIPEPILP